MKRNNNMMTDQELFWAGEFGDDFISRCSYTPEKVKKTQNYFRRVLRTVPSLDSVIEFGANAGINLNAIATLYSDIRRCAVEINEQAAKKLSSMNDIEVFHGSILDYVPHQKCDLSFTKGVLIHVNPDKLNEAYDIIYRSSRRYILVAEYFNPTPVQVNYRGHKERLFKRDFAGEMLDRYPDLKLIDYGFAYIRDDRYSMDDETWFLMEIERNK